MPCKETRTAGWRPPPSASPIDLNNGKRWEPPPLATETEAAVNELHGIDASQAAVLRAQYCTGRGLTLKARAWKVTAWLMELPNPPLKPLTVDAYRRRLLTAKDWLARRLFGIEVSVRAELRASTGKAA